MADLPLKDDTLNAWLLGAQTLIEGGVAIGHMSVCPVAMAAFCRELIQRRAHETEQLPEALRDPLRVMQHGRALLGVHERETRKAIYEFLGWLIGDIPELHSVEVPRLADSWERYRAKIDEPGYMPSAPETDSPLVRLVREAIDYMGSWEYDDLRNWRQRAEAALTDGDPKYLENRLRLAFEHGWNQCAIYFESRTIKQLMNSHVPALMNLQETGK